MPPRSALHTTPLSATCSASLPLIPDQQAASGAETLRCALAVQASTQDGHSGGGGTAATSGAVLFQAGRVWRWLCRVGVGVGVGGCGSRGARPHSRWRALGAAEQAASAASKREARGGAHATPRRGMNAQAWLAQAREQAAALEVRGGERR